MPRRQPAGKRLLPDAEIASGWYRSGGKEKMAPKEKRAINKPKTPKRGKLFKLELDFNQAAAILPTEPIYSFGWNSSGQLGLGKTKSYPSPQLVWGMMRKGESLARVEPAARHRRQGPLSFLRASSVG